MKVQTKVQHGCAILVKDGHQTQIKPKITDDIDATLTRF
jgi:hypothetical protein